MKKSVAAENTNPRAGTGPAGLGLEASAGARSASETLDLDSSGLPPPVCYCRNAVFTRNNRRVPPPPQQVAFFQRKNPCPYKRHSCPSFGPSTHQSSSSSPPVQTSLITGPDPLGWKLRGSPQRRSNRLSLQIAVPAVPAPDTPTEDPSPKTTPRLRTNPPPRRHSESSAFPRPPMTPQALKDVHLCPAILSDDPDAVFEEVFQDREKVKVPPKVPEKTAMARQIAQLIALSRRRCGSVPRPAMRAEKNANRVKGSSSHFQASLSRMLATQLGKNLKTDLVSIHSSGRFLIHKRVSEKV